MSAKWFIREAVILLYPLVSVLLPVYNGEAYVRGAIESVLAQEYPNFEFIIAENASTDGTAAIIDEYSGDRRVRVLHSRVTVPRLENFVRVFDSAAQESCWLKFIGDDDRFLPGCLAEMVRAAEQSVNVGLVSSYYYDGERLVTGSLQPDQQLVKGPQLLRRILLDREARATVFSPVTLMIAHRVYREMGGFRVDLLHSDSELFHRILNRYDFAYVHKPLTVSGYHSGSGQAYSTKKGFTFAEAYLIRYHNLKHYDNVKLTACEKERIKSNLVNDSTGYMLARIAHGDFRGAYRHLLKIPLRAVYHLPLSLAYFLGLALKKIVRREPINLLKRKRK